MSPAGQEQGSSNPTAPSPQPGARAPQSAARRARIVVDAAGGDAPQQERLAGVLGAAQLYPDVGLLVCGDRPRMERELVALGACPPNVELIHAPEAIGMHESPVQALKAKKQSSIAVGVEMVAQGAADAFVSAGNTGAVSAASSLKLGRLEGVQRPGIAAAMLVIDHPVVAIDVGANMDCRPTHLLQYGVMADVFARKVLGMERPRVGLLNVGEEAAKGNDAVKHTFELLSEADLNFVGNVEPDRIIGSGCDIVVCDGFVGNVMLKTSEALALRLVEWMADHIKGHPIYRLGLLLSSGVFRHLRRCADFSEYGGAPLLGVKGVTIITHGTSGARAIQNAIREARAFVQMRVNEHIEEALLRSAALRVARR